MKTLTLTLVLLSVAVAWADVPVLTEGKSELVQSRETDKLIANPQDSRPCPYDNWLDCFFWPRSVSAEPEMIAEPREPLPCPYDNWLDCFFWPAEENRTSGMVAWSKPEL